MSAPHTSRFLEALSPASRDRLLAVSKKVDLPVRTPLQDQEHPPKYAYFMTSGIASVVVFLADGGSAEVAIIGREGLTGGLSLLGPAATGTECFIQMAGTGLPYPFCRSQGRLPRFRGNSHPYPGGRATAEHDDGTASSLQQTA